MTIKLLSKLTTMTTMANITIELARFGSFAIGDADMGGALDSVDGAAVGTARDDMSGGVGTDADVKYTLPTIVEGLTVKGSWSAEDGTVTVLLQTRLQLQLSTPLVA